MNNILPKDKSGTTATNGGKKRMKSSKRIFTLLILFTSVLIFSMLTVTAVSLSEQKTFPTDEDIHIETKYKQVSINKITFNANGGKIGTKTKVIKNINKGSKIKKFPANPKRTGYTFKGWYTKKSGGKKISVNTKPGKSVTVYAQWKSARVLNANEKKLVGVWSQHAEHGDWWYNNNSGYGEFFSGIEKIIPRDKSYNNMFLFKKDGTFVWTYRYLYNWGSLDASRPTIGGVYLFHGDFRVANGKIVTSNVKAISTTGFYYGKPTGWKTSSGSSYKFDYTPSSIKVQIVDYEKKSTWEEYYKR
ncbi:MAG: InlB B-repeat-containing protein [Methanobrevibacter sp.]|nr:InlB B-repeat-containing protein [Methanobrevibacter sp.]